MKVLKIENGKGLFLNKENEYKTIDEITKDDIIFLVNAVLKENTNMDEYKAELVSNQAHQIIYKSIYEKIKSLEQNKNGFTDESVRKYLDAIKRYLNNA